MEGLPLRDRAWLVSSEYRAAVGDALAAVAERWRDRTLHVIYGMLNTKAARDFLRPLGRLAASLTAVEIPGVEASLSAEEAALRFDGGHLQGGRARGRRAADLPRHLPRAHR